MVVRGDLENSIRSLARELKVRREQTTASVSEKVGVCGRRASMCVPRLDVRAAPRCACRASMWAQPRDVGAAPRKKGVPAAYRKKKSAGLTPLKIWSLLSSGALTSFGTRAQLSVLHSPHGGLVP